MPVQISMRTEADVGKNSQPKGPTGDHDVILHFTLHTVQDLPIQEERLHSNLLVKTFRAADLLLWVVSGSLSASIPGRKAQYLT